MALIDGWYAVVPRRVPDRAALERCRIVAHRGVHDGEGAPENTLAAFQRALDAGIWGIELDLRWTRDLEPVVLHDPDASRVFGHKAVIADCDRETLRRTVPSIPTLREVVDRFAGKLHLMIEIKAEPYPDPDRQAVILADCLAALSPGADYHFLALDPDLFQLVPFAPPGACLPVAELNVPSLSRTAIERGLGGLTGHFLLLTDRIKGRHEAAGQRVGTGFIASKRGLFRELDRGVEWVFSDRAPALKRHRDRALAAATGR